MNAWGGAGGHVADEFMEEAHAICLILWPLLRRRDGEMSHAEE